LIEIGGTGAEKDGEIDQTFAHHGVTALAEFLANRRKSMESEL
jgi:hypothetical protein